MVYKRGSVGTAHRKLTGQAAGEDPWPKLTQRLSTGSCRITTKEPAFETCGSGFSYFVFFVFFEPKFQKLSGDHRQAKQGERESIGAADRHVAGVTGELYRKPDVEEHSHVVKWVALAMGKNNWLGRNSRVVCDNSCEYVRRGS